MINRRKTPSVVVGNVKIGSDWPIVVQSMTNTDTANVESTFRQVAELAEAGSELVRVTVNTGEAASAIPEIAKRLQQSGLCVPLVGDFHYNGHLLLEQYPECAGVLAKYRINPGNVGMGRQHDANFARLIQVARSNGKPVRIGVNWGSLDQGLITRLMDENARRAQPWSTAEVIREAMVLSALESAAFAERCGLPRDLIVLSAKVSGVQDLIQVYRQLAERCDYPLHLGLTEAGMGSRGIVSSSAAMAVLLQEGIGDTIRVSLTPAPGGDRREEVLVAQQLLQSMGFRNFRPQVTACPGCGRTTSTLFQRMAEQIQGYLDRQMKVWRAQYPGITELRVAVMGCIVNGPGESKHAHIGISLPGTEEDPKAPVFVDGRLLTTLKGPTIVPDFMHLVDAYVAKRFGSTSSGR